MGTLLLLLCLSSGLSNAVGTESTAPGSSTATAAVTKPASDSHKVHTAHKNSDVTEVTKPPHFGYSKHQIPLVQPTGRWETNTLVDGGGTNEHISANGGLQWTAPDGTHFTVNYFTDNTGFYANLTSESDWIYRADWFYKESLRCKLSRTITEQGQVLERHETCEPFQPQGNKESTSTTSTPKHAEDVDSKHEFIVDSSYTGSNSTTCEPDGEGGYKFRSMHNRLSPLEPTELWEKGTLMNAGGTREHFTVEGWFRWSAPDGSVYDFDYNTDTKDLHAIITSETISFQNESLICKLLRKFTPEGEFLALQDSCEPTEDYVTANSTKKTKIYSSQGDLLETIITNDLSYSASPGDVSSQDLKCAVGFRGKKCEDRLGNIAKPNIIAKPSDRGKGINTRR